MTQNLKEILKGKHNNREVKKAKAVGLSTFRRIKKLRKDGLLDLFVFEQIDVCESCLAIKMIYWINT
ncbi:hypothetical protein GQ457_03G019090 [Hibiscus cannabinus]